MWNSATRFLRIVLTVLRYRLDTFIPIKLLPWYLKYTLGIVLAIGRKGAERNRGERLRLALESLGPIFVKFGQILSTRRDLLPDDVADELARLQDRVPPFSGDLAVAIIEKDLNAKIDDIFDEFDRTPLASASIAQVHTAKLKTGEHVVAKVIRPKIEKTIRQDIKLLYMLARFVAKTSTDGRRLRPVEVVQDYEYTILDELDLAKEAANTGLLQRNFTDSDLLYVPNIYWDYSRRNVMVMERISGIPVADIPALREHNVNMKVLAERGVEIFFTQVFSHSFFHADMHPGNIFVDPSNPERPKYIAIDCAIMGSLDDADKNYLARNLLAFFKRDYRMVAELHVESGWVPKGTPVHAFESAIRSVCEPMFAKPLKEISFGQVLLGLFQTARRFNMEVQPQLVLLEKTLLNIEGLGRQLYPDLDLWVTAKPFLERWMSEQVGPRRLLDEVKKQAPEWAGQLPQIPNLVFSTLTHLSHQEARIAEQTESLERLRKEMRRSRRNQPFKLLGLLAIGGAWITTDNIALEHLAQADMLSLALFLGGIYLLVLKP
ncbi:ubiquinone biosynthesis regulatory protein kinase UbiB [Marinomonas atlantica]|uniref:ubiquinone biosynthesis regulatory protein kinase UbiB n=1 Tax=Marinomonas atlantica TaxID=1806668 RepID=UPI0008333DD4|nr:ubiquinone biosynthesis regulatory protein kinase UbiB [Marinomonas atlantica]MCO4784993.1 ubiquinone biosynthesis regulatory protein kinase UbiB [Marinomonas atlantica]